MSDTGYKTLKRASAFNFLKWGEYMKRAQLAERKLEQLKQDHEKWCPHFHDKYQEMMRENEWLRKKSMLDEVNRLRDVLHELNGANKALREALDELVDIVEGHLQGGDKLDSFTLQPARIALKAGGHE